MVNHVMYFIQLLCVNLFPILSHPFYNIFKVVKPTANVFQKMHGTGTQHRF